MEEEFVQERGHGMAVAIVEVAMDADEGLEDDDEGSHEGAGSYRAKGGAEEHARWTALCFSAADPQEGKKRTLLGRPSAAR